MGEWGTPDWLNPLAYPGCDSTTLHEWWWEFTRRRPDYRSLWEGAQAAEGQAYRYAPDVDAFRLMFGMSVVQDPSAVMSDREVRHWRFPTNYTKSHQQPLAEQWGSADAEKFAASVEHRGKVTDDHGHRLYNFDLTQPLGPQIERAERHLKIIQEDMFGSIATRRPRRANWPNFLRVLDGRDSGASLAEIADALWPGQEKTPQSARDALEAARELRDNFPI